MYFFKKSTLQNHDSDSRVPLAGARSVLPVPGTRYRAIPALDRWRARSVRAPALLFSSVPCVAERMALHASCALCFAATLAAMATRGAADTGLQSGSSPSVTLGNVRVQALSPTLLRVEPKGPHGFEDRTTFMVTSREWEGINISKRTDGRLSTAHYDVRISSTGGIVVTSPAGELLYNSTAADTPPPPTPSPCDGMPEENCTTSRWINPRLPESWICIWQNNECQEEGQHLVPNLLHWPAPLQKKAYALVDSPRFFVPDWELTPAPATVAPSLKDTNGYDFSNDVDGDTYIFLLGDDLASWHRSRIEFVKLVGGCPLLPDYAFGTWFTWFTSFTLEEAKSNVTRWEAGKLPLDIWGLDMNWRHTENVSTGPKAQKGQARGEVGTQDHYYDHPNEVLFPGTGPYGSSFSEWFDWLRSRNLRTYFNDHPFPVASRNAGGLQTSPAEVTFRWDGLSAWMKRGLSFWWFDHNWLFSIPPPFVNSSTSLYDWRGLDNTAWGSHLYYTTAAQFLRQRRNLSFAENKFFQQRPLALTKFGLPDWRGGLNPIMQQESPAHHRYPVWWTGDGVDLRGSVESMVDAGVHGLKPYVHSDCGGDGSEGRQAGDLLRWTAHCAFGTIFRFHGADHRPWQYGEAVEDTIRQYITARYKLAPSLIAAGQHATRTGYPFVTRCDLLWPEHATAGAANSTQYIFLNDTLVAPIWSGLISSHPAPGVQPVNISSRQVWIPPGDWQDAWDGSIVTGPKLVTATQPYEKIPMWHRKAGGLTVLTDAPGLRIADGNWSTLTLESFPAATAMETQRSVYTMGVAARTDLWMRSDGHGGVEFEITSSTDGAIRRGSCAYIWMWASAWLQPQWMARTWSQRR
eukprot:SAG31_NODE_2253_length_6075_cov_2.406459_2_plen_859_part_00